MPERGIISRALFKEMAMRFFVLFSALLLALPLFMIISRTVSLGIDYRTANRESAGIAPEPAKTPEAVVQVYAARALNWRGIFGVHTWIATKAENAPDFMIYQVIGWRLWRNLPAVSVESGVPDRYWFGNRPEIIADLRGADASRAIAVIREAVRSYPYAREYTIWPGPNSNTFTAYLARQVPELKVDFPVTALGKDFPIDGAFFERAPSGTGYQLSMYGLLGLMLARREGLEVNLLGLSFGLDFGRPALKLPFIGRLGFPPD